MNLANQVTLGRLGLSAVYFVLLAVAAAKGQGAPPLLLDAAFGLFIIAAVTDAVDGYVARRYGMVTSFGRVADPFVDKVLVCGSLVFLCAVEGPQRLLPAWIVVCVLAREFAVHGIRSQAEAQGRDFGATWWGKHKMVLQCFAVGGLLLDWGRLHDAAWLETLNRVLVWVMLVSTLASGAAYAWQARSVLRMRSDGPPPEPGARS